jgi:hypothetical protein
LRLFPSFPCTSSIKKQGHGIVAQDFSLSAEKYVSHSCPLSVAHKPRGNKDEESRLIGFYGVKMPNPPGAEAEKQNAPPSAAMKGKICAACIQDTAR